MFTLNLVTPEKRMVTDTEVEEVIVPAFRGQLDILPGHAPLMTTLGAGSLKYRLKGSTSYETVVVGWGYAQVNPQGVVVLAETAEQLAEIDRVRAEAAKKKAEAQLLEPILEPNQIKHLQHELAINTARLEATGGSSEQSH